MYTARMRCVRSYSLRALACSFLSCAAGAALPRRATGEISGHKGYTPDCFSSSEPAGIRQVHQNPAACQATVLMVENRTVQAINEPRVYHYSKTVALNALYARRHNFTFTVLRPTQGPMLQGGSHPAWCKLKAITSAMSRVDGPPPCHWMMVLDSDAMVREHHVDFMQLLNLRADTRHVLVLAREDPNSPIFDKQKIQRHKRGIVKAAPTLNTGVMFVRAGAQATQLLNAWAEARIHPVCAAWNNVHAFEQACLEALLNSSTPGLSPALSTLIRFEPMMLFNSPYGSFVRHIWGGPGRPLRQAGGALDDEMRVQGIWTKADHQRILDDVQCNHLLTMPC